MQSYDLLFNGPAEAITCDVDFNVFYSPWVGTKSIVRFHPEGKEDLYLFPKRTMLLRTVVVAFVKLSLSFSH